MITLEQYFGGKPHSAAQRRSAARLLSPVNALVQEAIEEGFTNRADPDTGTEISGSKGGAGDGGFRLPTATTGRSHSSHMILYSLKDGVWVLDEEAEAGIDVFDPVNWLDNWITKFDIDGGFGNTKLEKYRLYREAPGATLGWCHLTPREPGSKRRTFFP